MQTAPGPGLTAFTLGDLRPELMDSAVDRCRIGRDAALGQEISNITIR